MVTKDSRSILLKSHPFEEAYVVLIDNWFDHKWLEFESNQLITTNLAGELS